MNYNFCVLSLVVLGFIHSGKTQLLQNIPSKLSSLAVNLHYDRDIQNEINSLALDGEEVAISFQNVLKIEGGKILTEKNRLVKTSYPEDVEVNTLRTILERTRTLLQSEQKDIIAFETDIHLSIGKCQSRKSQHGTNRKYVNNKLESLPQEITSLEEQIRAHEESVRIMEQSARDLDGHADNLRKTAEEKTLSGLIGGFFGTLLGVALAPFTGGASLAIALTAAGIQAWVNLNDADDCKRSAHQLRDKANSKRQEAQILREKRDELEAKRINLLSEIRKQEESLDELQQAESELNIVSGYLRSSIEVINDLLLSIENMDTAMKDAELHANSFEINQNAFARQPEKLDKSSQVHLDNLKASWQRLAQILTQHGAKAVLS